MTTEQRSIGVVCASAGNHALAMAYHGQQLGIPVTCVMPLSAPLAKVNKCTKFGANIVMHGLHIGEAREYAKKKFSDFKYVNGYDHPDILAGIKLFSSHDNYYFDIIHFYSEIIGAGTMGVEIFEQVPDVDVIIVPTGGGGLLAGVSVAIKALKPEVEVRSDEGMTAELMYQLFLTSVTGSCCGG